MTCLKNLNLQGNSLEGQPTLPLTLTDLNLQNNWLSGTFPGTQSTAGCDFEAVYINENRFSAIGDLSNCTRLRTLEARTNKISSTLRDVIPENGTFQNLELLDLSDNRVPGTIPENLLNKAPRLWTLNLGRNLISGTIPEMIVCYNSQCGSSCLDDSPSADATLNDYNAQNPSQRVAVDYRNRPACSVLERYCGDDSPIGEIVRKHCRKICGTQLQQLQVFSNRLRSPLPTCLAGAKEWEEREFEAWYQKGCCVMPWPYSV